MSTIEGIVDHRQDKDGDDKASEEEGKEEAGEGKGIRSQHHRPSATLPERLFILITTMMTTQ